MIFFKYDFDIIKMFNSARGIAVGAVPARRALHGRAEQLHVRLHGHGLHGRRLLRQHRRVRAAALPERRHLLRRRQQLPLQLLSRIHWCVIHVHTGTVHQF